MFNCITTNNPIFIKIKIKCIQVTPFKTFKKDPDPENSRPPYVNKLVIKNTFIISIIDRNTGRFRTMSM